jgi:exodeoxyribonuclease VII large subunit
MELTDYPKKCMLAHMAQLPLFQTQSWSVTSLTRHIRQLLENDSDLQDVWVQGEVSNFSRPASGHLYFTLKDATAALRCVMWRNDAQRQKLLPRDGDAVEVHGSVGLYELSGVYQLYIDQIRPTGEGLLYQEFLRLKERLEEEGLFDPQRKRPIPRLPGCIGIVTSPTGAALQDILNTLKRRCPMVRVVIAPAPVQGEDAPPQIVAALQNLEREVKPDVVLLARGGGSIEDLWAFNDERLARAIVACSVPVICGVGHETDFTIVDFAADLRAPTPTAAAEQAAVDQSELSGALKDVSRRLVRAMEDRLQTPRWRLDELIRRLQMLSPRSRIRSDRQWLDELARRSRSALAHSLLLQRTRLASLDQSLAALNPQAVLRRGYAIVTSPHGKVVRSVEQVQSGDHLRVRVADGQFVAQVEEGSAEQRDG